jgi:hypothetical protein
MHSDKLISCITSIPRAQGARISRRIGLYSRQMADAWGPPVYRKLGRVVAYDQTDLDAWLDSCRRTSTSDVGR